MIVLKEAGCSKKSYSCEPEKKDLGDFTMDAQTRDPAGSHVVAPEGSPRIFISSSDDSDQAHTSKESYGVKPTFSRSRRFHSGDFLTVYV